MTCTLVSEDGQCWSSSQHPTSPASSAHLFQRLGNIYFSAGQVNYAKAILFVTCLHLQSRHPSLFHDHVVASQGSLFSPKIGLFLKTNIRDLSFYRNAKERRRNIYCGLKVLHFKSYQKSLNPIHFWGQEVNIWAAAGDHGGIASH